MEPDSGPTGGLPGAVTSTQGLEAVDRLQGNWERGWQSATAAVLTVLLLVTIILFWRSQSLRVRDKERTEDKLMALARENAAQAAENSKQTLLHTHVLTELRAEVAELRRILGGRRPP